MPKKAVDKGAGGSSLGQGQNPVSEKDGIAATYVGGRGDDTYYVDHINDAVIEKKNGGTDSVTASVDWTLSENVENLSFEGDIGFTGAGNIENNEILGNIGDDTLSGNDGDDFIVGGEGADILDGGLGSDTASFEGLRSDYLVEIDGDTLLVTSLVTGSQDVLTGFEWLFFDDARVSVASLFSAPPPALETASDFGDVSEDGVTIIRVLDNDSGDGLRIVGVTQGQYGSVTINNDGTLSYTPEPDVIGEDTFSYTIIDASGASATGNVTIEILPVNDAPIAVDDNFAIDLSADYSGTLNTLTNDADPDGDTLSVIAAGATEDTMVSDDGSGAPLVFQTAAGGEVTMNADGSFTYSVGDPSLLEDTFTYAVSDGSDALSTATVSLSITASTPEVPAPVPQPTPSYVDGLIYGDPYRLNAGDELGTGVTVTYSFLDTTPDYYLSDSTYSASFRAFSLAQEQATRNILSEIESFSNLTFVEVPQDQATLTFGLADLSGFSGLAYRPEGTAINTVASDVWIDSTYAFRGGDFDSGSIQYTTLIHEIGHAIGLDHAALPDGEENQQYTVMDASGHPTFADATSSYQLYDVAALQYLYGANTTDTAGNDVYTYADLVDQTHVIWDADGIDTIDLSAANIGVHLDLNDGAFSDVTALGSDNVAIAFGTTIENAIGGAYDDTIVGNEADNWIDGGTGNDSLSGGGGADTFVFGADWGQDTVEDFSVGEDRLDFSGTGLMLDDILITRFEGNTQISDGENTLTLAGVDFIEEELNTDILFTDSLFF